MRRKRMKGAVAMAVPRAPSFHQRIKSTAESAARDVSSEHPMVKTLRTKIERRVAGAVKGALRGVRSGR